MAELVSIAVMLNSSAPMEYVRSFLYGLGSFSPERLLAVGDIEGDLQCQVQF